MDGTYNIAENLKIIVEMLGGESSTYNIAENIKKLRGAIDSSVEGNNKVNKSGDTMTGPLNIDAIGQPASLDIQSDQSGGLNTSDSTGRIQLHSHQKAQKNNDSGQPAHYGEVIRADLHDSKAKAVFAFRENYIDPETNPRTVAWLVAHGEANNSTSANPNWHNHFSIELPDSNGELQTSLEFPFAPFGEPNAYGMPLSKAYVRAVVGLIAAADMFVEGDNASNKNLYFSSKKYKDETGKRFGIQLDNTAESGSNTGSDTRFNVYNDDGSFRNTALFIKRSNSYVGVNTTSPTRPLDVNGNTIRIRTPNTPVSSTATGEPGCIRWDANYLYVCVATDTWRRVEHQSW